MLLVSMLEWIARRTRHVGVMHVMVIFSEFRLAPEKVTKRYFVETLLNFIRELFQIKKHKSVKAKYGRPFVLN